MRAVTHLEKVIAGEVSAVTHLEKVIAGEVSAVTYTEKVIAGEATPITHLQKVIAGVASPVTHLEQVWAGGSPTPSEHEYTGAVPVTITANGQPLLDYTIYGNTVQSGTPTPDNPIMPQGTGDLETVGVKAGQYKIPISSANTTTPVYLGEVETTRKIYKMRLINPLSTTEASYGYRLLFLISSHRAPSYQYGGGRCNITKWNADYNKVGFVAAIQNVFITQNIAEWATLEGATAWLDEHEVYIWYVLAEPETGVVNEPLMKIGEYADTLSMEQAGVSIPTLNGQTIVDVDTALKPSEMYIKYKG